MAEARSLDSEDWAVFRAIRLRALSTDPGAFGRSHAEEVDRSPSFWIDRLMHPDRAVFVVELDDRPVGLVGIGSVDPGLAELTSMWVDPAVRGRGVGRALVDAALEWCRSHTIGRVELWVVHDNEPAIALYRRLGFVDVAAHAAADDDPCRSERRLGRDL